MSATATATVEPQDPALMTLEAWADMDEDEPGELVDGRVEEEELASVLHETVVSWFIGELRTWVVPRGGKVFGSELKLAVSSSRGRKPDVSMYAPGARMPRKRAALVKELPSVIVEVLSPTPKDARRDRVEKLHEYARLGVRYYWLVDPELRVLEVLELGPDQRYTIVLSASDGNHPVPGFEGFAVDLDALWAEIDALPGDDEEAGSEG